MTHNAVVRVPIASDADVVAARRQARELAETTNMGRTSIALLATAVSEIARNIAVHAGRGYVDLRIVQVGARRGVEVVATDAGPGIADLERAMEDGWSSSGSLGLGLPGARRLVDEFSVQSSLDRGTSVTMVKWASP